MKRKAASKKVKAGSKLAKGNKYACDTCGVVVSVDEACGCDPCDLVCCGQNMQAVPCF